MKAAKATDLTQGPADALQPLLACAEPQPPPHTACGEQSGAGDLRLSPSADLHHSVPKALTFGNHRCLLLSSLELLLSYLPFLAPVPPFLLSALWNLPSQVLISLSYLE